MVVSREYSVLSNGFKLVLIQGSLKLHVTSPLNARCLPIKSMLQNNHIQK